MAALILPQRFNQQPQQVPPINWGNPITRNLEFAWVASNPNVLQRGASGVSITINTLARTPTSQGVAGLNSTAGTEVHISDNAIFFPNAWTSLAVASFASLTGGSIMSEAIQNPGVDDRTMYIDTSGKLTGYLFDGAQKHAKDTVAVVAGLPYVLAASSGGSSIDVWKNGVNVGSTATSNGGYGYGGTAPGFTIGGYAGGTSDAFLATTGNTRFAMQLWWTRALTAAEHASLAVNPWQIFLTPARRIWAEEFISGGPGGSAGQMYVIAT